MDYEVVMRLLLNDNNYSSEQSNIKMNKLQRLTFLKSKEFLLAGQKELGLENSIRFGKVENVTYQTEGEQLMTIFQLGEKKIDP